MDRRTLLLVIGMIGVALVVMRPARGSTCASPLFIPSDHAPREIVTRLIADLGGLPKTSLDLHTAQRPEPTVFPVEQWTILGTSARPDKGLLTLLIDDDPTYGYTIDIQVHYADGDEAVVRWSSWRYGRVLCPIVLTSDGPPGRLIVSTTTNRSNQ